VKYVAPEHGLAAYTCPHCGVLARQYHWGFDNQVNSQNLYQAHNIKGASFSATQCENRKALSVWVGPILVHPNRGGAPTPNPEMPPGVKADYEEAARVLVASPRSAAALLRLAIQKLCVHLGGKGKNINDDVGDLVKAGLPSRVQQSLDIVRVTGNNAVHPGQLDVNDVSVAGQLFVLVNVIVEYMIEIPQRIEGLYGSLPDAAKMAIDKRDA
jgi:hypothetical protein